MAVPFLDLKAQYADLRAEIGVAINEVLESCAFANGPAVKRFEQAFAQYVEADEVVCVNSGTSALHLSLLVSGVGPGDEVIVPAMTFVATAWAVSYLGAKPVFVDVSETDYALNPAKVEAAVTPRTKAVVPVHLYGLSADLGALEELCARHGLTLIEDAAQAHGARYQGRHVGTFGKLGCFSFYPGKNLGAYGEAGAVVTGNEELDRKIRMLRDHGQAKKYHHTLIGWNARMDGIQGSVLSVKLKHLPAWNDARRKNAARYDGLLMDLKGVTIPRKAAYAKHVYHIYAICVKNRDALIATLAAKDIHCGIHYPIPLHLQEAYKSLGYRKGAFPVAEKAASEFVSLPMYAELTGEQIAGVAAELKAVIAVSVS